MSWTVQNAMRARREALGLSQADLARALGVSKSLLSRIEAGERQPTDEQVASLAQKLQLPIDLLLLGSGRLPTDVRGVVEANAAEVVSAVRQRTEAQAIIYPTAPRTVPLPKSESIPSGRGSLSERIDVQKTSTTYRAHSYHTKVPPDAIQPFIEAFTRPGEIISDPFCGSGMTGVAALMSGRNALLSDLSPAAVHIARNYTTFCDPVEFARALQVVETAIQPTIAWLYRPIGSDRMIEYTTWSDVYRCPACHGKIVYWDVVQGAGGTDGDRLACLSCGAQSRKAELEWIGEEPVQSHTSSLGSNRIECSKPSRKDLALIEEAQSAPIPYWIPAVHFGPEREMWRAGHRRMGISDVTGFFTRRNLHALAALRHTILGAAEGRVREALLFAFTAAVNRASRRYQWNAKRPTNVMTGTLYISSLRYEWNVWSLFRRKAADVLRYYQAFSKTAATVEVFQRSAANLDCIPDSSVDMVFMDPPFGSNIFYADSSLLWESWLGELTDPADEIVVNKHRRSAAGGKSVEDYGELMRQSFAHAARVLKRNGRAVLAFSNSDDLVWHTIQKALGDAGFQTCSVHLLNKGQPSIKGVKGVTGKENVTTFDLVLCLEHRKSTVQMVVPFAPPSSVVDQVVRETLEASKTPGGCRTDEVYSAVIRAVVEANYSVSGITMPGIANRCRELGATERDGKWVLPEVGRASASADFVAGYIASRDSLPLSVGNDAIPEPLGKLSIPGGRNSAFYLAHSYHTKVPPEAIEPFIEHYSKPGDVILDPFCGSGMTGVAAALAGRRAILNDLSPASVHLAWNHTRPCEPDALAEGFAAVEAKVKRRFDSLYQTKHTDGTPARIHWTLWSTRHLCSLCSKEFQLWDVVDQKSGRLGKTISCPGCRKEQRRSNFLTLDSQPAWIAYETAAGKRFEKRADNDDIHRAVNFRREDINAWYPKIALSANREMYIRCALQLHGISSIADFYTARNLEALALLWQEIMAIPDERVRRGLAFAFTNTAWHGTRMRRFNARGGQRPLTGTLYIPQLSSEANVLEVMRNKVAQLQRYYRSYRSHASDLPAILLGSATDLAGIPEGSIDYVFTDPPFGSNIFYADCNLIWESWLGRLTDVRNEAVVNRSLSADKGGKSLSDYGGLMNGAMREIARVLKPEGWATVVFHNTDAEVWNTIHKAASDAGFVFHEAASLDRKQQSHKGYKGRSGAEDVAHFDIVMTLRKPGVSKTRPRLKIASPDVVDLQKLVRAAMKKSQIAAHGLQGVHAEVMRRLASNGQSNFVGFADVRRAWEQAVSAQSNRTKKTHRSA